MPNKVDTRHLIQHKTTRMVMNAKQSRHLIQHKTTRMVMNAKQIDT